MLVNSERGDYTIPYSHWTYDDDTDDGQYGTINFKVDNNKIMIVDEYSSEKFRVHGEEDSSELERCVYVGNSIYMLGTHDGGEEKNYEQPMIDAVEYK